MAYFTGMTVRLQVTFLNFSGAATDPTTITVYWQMGSGATGTSVYATSGTDNWLRTATGVYSYDLAITSPGLHTYGFQGTGTVAVYDATTFTVSPRPVG